MRMDPRMAGQPINERLSEFEALKSGTLPDCGPGDLSYPLSPPHWASLGLTGCLSIYGCDPSPAHVILLAIEIEGCSSTPSGIVLCFRASRPARGPRESSSPGTYNLIWHVGAPSSVRYVSLYYVMG